MQNGVTYYFAGDTVPDVAALAGADMVIPMHFDLFPWNGERPGNFSDYAHERYPGLPCHIMARGRRFRYAAQ